ncbi:ASCH domain-containing protein [Candidatus Daviesbacteria bacterium]|nr:ASCH domain-containing protein [Candidatus Daviesbacteria bacterium]
MKKHLAIFKGDAGDLILQGKKTIESRFSKVKNVPFGIISAGDLVYIKPSGKDIIGQFRVKKVHFFDNLDLSDLKFLRKRYGKELVMEEQYWDKRKDARFGTIIFIGSFSRFITSPVRYHKKDLRGWVVLGKE